MWHPARLPARWIPQQLEAGNPWLRRPELIEVRRARRPDRADTRISEEGARVADSVLRREQISAGASARHCKAPELDRRTQYSGDLRGRIRLSIGLQKLLMPERRLLLEIELERRRVPPTRTFLVTP